MVRSQTPQAAGREGEEAHKEQNFVRQLEPRLPQRRKRRRVFTLQALAKGGRGSCRGKYLVTEPRGTLDAAGT